MKTVSPSVSPVFPNLSETLRWMRRRIATSRRRTEYLRLLHFDVCDTVIEHSNIVSLFHSIP